MTLVYSGDRDGYASADFHSLVDSQGATISVVKNDFDKVFGFYTDIPWASAGGNILRDRNSYEFYFDDAGVAQKLTYKGSPQAAYA